MSDIKKGTQFSEKNSKGCAVITFLHDPKAIKAKTAELAKKAEVPAQEDLLASRLAELKAKEAELAEKEAQAKILAEKEEKLKALEAEITKREEALKVKETPKK